MYLAVLIAFFLLATLAGIATEIFSLWFSSRLWRIPGVTWPKVVRLSLTITLVLFLVFPVRFLFLFMTQDSLSDSGGVAILITVGLLIFEIVVPCAMIKRAYQIGGRRAFGTWITASLASLLIALGMAWCLKTTVAEAFVIPTGAMAPTLLGLHSQLDCENCGYQFSVSMSHRLSAYGHPQEFVSSCPMCRQTKTVSEDTALRTGDRILVDKRSVPKRWDLVVCLSYEPYGGGNMNYVKRLVALPGETLRIAEGDLFVNKRRVTKAPHELESLWIPVHDTKYQHRNPELASAGWEPATEEPVWKRQDSHWECQAAGTPSSELLFARPINNSHSYNLLDDQAMHDQLGVGDVRIRCHLDHCTGSGNYGFLWEFDQRRIRTTITADGGVTMVSEPLENGVEDNSDQASGKLASSKLLQKPLEFAYRDGKAFLSHGTEIIASIDVAGPQPGDRVLYRDPSAPRWSGDLKPPTIHSKIAIFAEDVSLGISRIQIHRDVYYVAPEDFPSMGGPNIPNPITLKDDEFFVMGDNSSFSKDSRFTGPISQSDFVGVPRWCYWPPERVRQFEDGED